MSNEDLKKFIKAHPNKCPITGLEKCESYTIQGNVVYLPRPAYDAYTLPSYDKESQAFYRTKYDMDDDCRVTEEWLCDLDDLRDREDFEDIKIYYDIEKSCL